MTPAERAAFAREEIHDAIVDDGTLGEMSENHSQSHHHHHHHEMMNSSFHNSLSHLPTSGAAPSGDDRSYETGEEMMSGRGGGISGGRHSLGGGQQGAGSSSSAPPPLSSPRVRTATDLWSVSGGDDEDMQSHAYLFSVLEGAIPKFNDASAAANNNSGGGSKNRGGGASSAGNVNSGNSNSNNNKTFSSMHEQQYKRDQMEHAWEKVRRWLWSHPEPADRRAAAYVRGQADATSLHLACKLHNPPVEVVAALVEAAHDTAGWADVHGWLPLHHACANGASPEVLKILIDAYPQGKVAQDDQGRTPLHFYVTRSSDNVANMVLNAQLLCSDQGTGSGDATDASTAAAPPSTLMMPGVSAATLPDRGGMLPMHYACAYGTHPGVLDVLANVHPASLIAKERHGRTPMHLAMVNAHRDASPNTIRFLLQRSPESKQTINERDNDGFLPLHLLALSLKGYRMDELERRHNVGESLSLYLEAEPIPTADFLTAIQDLPDWLHDTAVVSRHVRNVLNDKIAKRFPTSILMLDGYLLLVWIVCFAVSTHATIDARFGPNSGDPSGSNKGGSAGGPALIICFVACVYFFFRELIQVVSLISLGCFSNWWKDPTNWLDCSVIVLVTYYAVLMATESSAISNDAFRSGVAFTQGLLWVSIIMFLKNTLVDFAVFVGGVFYVVQRLLAFLLAVGIILLAFAQMFYFLYTDTSICDPPAPILLPNGTEVAADPEQLGCTFPHCSFGYSLLQVYSMMMGEINTVNRYSTNLAAQIIFVVYAFLVVILLSNVLIAVVTDSYEIIQNDRAAIVFWNNRLDFVAEMDAIRYAIQRRFLCLGFGGGGRSTKRSGGSRQGSISAGAGGSGVVEVQEGPNSAEGTGGSKPEDAHHHEDDGTADYFRNAWHQVLLLFDDNLYDEVDWIEAVVYNVFRVLCVFVVIPLWLLAGALTAGWLWPPQVREYLFVQKEAVVSRAELERHKLRQLQEIQEGLRKLKLDMKHEMEGDRDEMLRMRTEVETIQSEVLADLQQVRELMSTLLGE
jgi:ankyrin repeat protein